ncbi:MAG TPA: hypothetical protein VFZ24_12120 [Longimicrobiales bacterium]
MLRRSLRATVLVLALCLLEAPAASAQRLDPVLQRVASAWQRGDVGAITALGARGGISLDIDGSSVGPLGSRQAAAVLRRVFDDRESVSARSRAGRTVGGEPPRAFGEIIWTTRARGTTIPERATLFIAFVHQDDGWRITEIRLMR